MSGPAHARDAARAGGPPRGAQPPRGEASAASFGGITLDAVDRAIIDTMQGGFPLDERPFATAAAVLGIGEDELIERIDRLLADGTLTRFGPLFDAARLGGAFTLAAIAVPQDRYDAVAATVNAFPEVAHNYARDHALNMWFVLATASPDDVAPTLARIEAATGLSVLDFPKEREYFVGLALGA